MVAVSSAGEMAGNDGTMHQRKSEMKKIGLTNDGNIIVEIEPDTWERIIKYGLDSIFDERKEEIKNEKKSEIWHASEVAEILSPLYSRGAYTPIRLMFVREEFDGSVEQLEKIAKGERPFDNVVNLGKKRRKLILEAIQEYRSKKA